MSWTGLTQVQRNQAIINAAVAALGTTGYNCKDWARLVVQNASSGAGGPTRNIPATQTDPNDYMWVSDPYAIGQSTTMQSARHPTPFLWTMIFYAFGRFFRFSACRYFSSGV